MNSQPGVTKITITLPTNAYFISGIRDFTMNMIKHATNFPPKWAFRFQSVVDELCNNAIEHGSSNGSEIRITFKHKPQEYLEISVEDTGTGKCQMNAKEIKALYDRKRSDNTPFTGIRGRGLAKIVGEWTDEINFQDREGGGLCVTVRKYLKNREIKEESSSITPTINLNTNFNIK